MTPPSHTRGFTLLEAIVALVIIGVTLIPVMAFLTNASRQLAVAADVTQRAFVQQTLLAYCETINPLSTPAGEVELTPTLHLRWTTEELVAPTKKAMPGSRAGDTRVGFYRINMVVIRDDQEWFSYSVRKVGFQFNPLGLAPGMGEIGGPR